MRLNPSLIKIRIAIKVILIYHFCRYNINSQKVALR